MWPIFQTAELSDNFVFDLFEIVISSIEKLKIEHKINMHEQMMWERNWKFIQ